MEGGCTVGLLVLLVWKRDEFAGYAVSTSEPSRQIGGPYRRRSAERRPELRYGCHCWTCVRVGLICLRYMSVGVTPEAENKNSPSWLRMNIPVSFSSHSPPPLFDPAV